MAPTSAELCQLRPAVDLVGGKFDFSACCFSAIRDNHKKGLKSFAKGKPFGRLLPGQGWEAQVYGAEMLSQDRFQQN